MAEIKLIGAKFLELKSKRDPDFSGKLEIKTNIKINSLDEVKEAKDTLKATYEFDVNYGALGEVKVKGALFFSVDAEAKKTLFENKEKKNYNTPEYLAVTNLIIQKASIKAFELEDELGLPIHIKLPSLSIKK